jgi:hypothetical protein
VHLPPLLCLVMWLPSHRAPSLLCRSSSVSLGVTLFFLAFVLLFGLLALRSFWALWPEGIEPQRGAFSFVSPEYASSGCWSSPCVEPRGSVVSEGDVGIIGILLVSAVPVRASTVPMVVWAGGSDLICVALPVLCSLVAAAAASMDDLAP